MASDCWVWNGTAEVPADVTVWNGTSETQANVEFVPTPTAWLMEDPLSTMANLTNNGVGTWDVATGVLNMASPVDGNRSRIVHSYKIDSIYDKHIVQVDIRIPTGFSAGSDNNLGVGFGLASFGTGDPFVAPRWNGSANKLSFLAYSVSWTDGPNYAWVAGQWYTVRVVWTPGDSNWKVYVDGVLVNTFNKSYGEANMQPSLFVSRYQSSAANYQFRNLKYWGGTLTATTP